MGDDPRQVYLTALRERGGDFAHDLKTPLNIVVLNAELLSMRIAKLGGDEKAEAYASGIDREIRRIGAIIDSFLSLLKIPENSPGPTPVVDLVELLRERLALKDSSDSLSLAVSREAVEMMARLLVQGLPNIFEAGSLEGSVETEGVELRVTFSGQPVENVEIGKALKFYYTDASGSSSVEMAAARVLSEMIGGSLELNDEDSWRPRLTLSLPLTQTDPELHELK